MIRPLVIALLLATPARAQPVWEPGTYLVPARWWDSDKNIWRDQPDPEYLGTCWQVVSIVVNNGLGNGYQLRLMSGTYNPWWSDEDEVFEPGWEDVYFSSTAFLEENPGGDNFTWLHGTFEPVAGCP